MPKWSHEAPEEPCGPALPIRRTPAYKPLVAIATSPDLIGTYTHFYKGHTVPCEHQAYLDPENPQSEDCDACHDGIPYRWHSYLSAVDQADGLHFIFECTAQATEYFTAYRDANQTLRGCVFQARRLNQRPNGRVIIQTKPADLTDRRLPQGPDLAACMAIIWSLPEGSVQTERRSPEKKTPIATIVPDLKKP